MLIRHHKLIHTCFAIIELVFLSFFERRAHIVGEFEFLLADDDIVCSDVAFTGIIPVEADISRYRREHRSLQFVRIPTPQDHAWNENPYNDHDGNREDQ
jgi:hypothetical protein